MNLCFCDENDIEIISIEADCQPYKEGDTVDIEMKVYCKAIYHSDIKDDYNSYKIIKIENKIKSEFFLVVLLNHQLQLISSVGK